MPVISNVRSLLRTITTLSVLALVAGRASAQLATMQVDSAFLSGAHYYGNIKFDPTLSNSPSDINGAYLSGFIVTPVAPTAAALGLPTSFLSYCIDMRDAIVVPGLNTFALDTTNNITVASPSVIARSNGSGPAAAWLYNQIAPTIANGFDSAALQLAIWEVMADWDGTVPGLAGLGFGTGNFQLTQVSDETFTVIPSAPLVAQAQAYLTVWSGQIDEALWLRGDPPKQDLIGPPTTTHIERIPEPGTLSLFALAGLLCVRKGMRRRRYCR
jgi:hypothetical protein